MVAAVRDQWGFSGWIGTWTGLGDHIVALVGGRAYAVPINEFWERRTLFWRPQLDDADHWVMVMPING